MRKSENLGYMMNIIEKDFQDDGYFLHHAVLNETVNTTKLRVVFRHDDTANTLLW